MSSCFDSDFAILFSINVPIIIVMKRLDKIVQQNNKQFFFYAHTTAHPKHAHSEFRLHIASHERPERVNSGPETTLIRLTGIYSSVTIFYSVKLVMFYVDRLAE